MPHKSLQPNKDFEASRIFALAFFICVLFLSACKDNFSTTNTSTSDRLHRATVIKIKDGDSIILRYAGGPEREARLFGIDAPEYNQAFGKQSKIILSNHVLKQSVLIENRGTDRYQRDIIIITRERDKKLINLVLIEQGAAWVYDRYQNDKSWHAAQHKAKAQQLGLWSLPQPIAPWKWRDR